MSKAAPSQLAISEEYGFPVYCYARDGKVSIFLDGQKLRACVAYDAVEGWADSYVWDERGNFVMDGDKPRIDRLFGKVQAFFS